MTTQQETQTSLGGQSAAKHDTQAVCGRDPISKWAPILLVSGIISYEYYIFQVLFLAKLTNHLGLFACIFITLVFNYFTVNLVWAWYKAIFTHPGAVAADINASYNNVEEIKAKAERDMKRRILKSKSFSDMKKRETMKLTADEETGLQTEEKEDFYTKVQKESYCFKCQRIKPPRAHHCKVCNTCVLRMDHHCPWVANCVGLKNQKYFILFLLNCTIAIFIVAMSFIFLYYFNYEEITNKKIFDENEDIMISVATMLAVALDLAIGFLFYFQVKAHSKNITTVEYHIDEMHTNNPFDKKSWTANFKDIFGIDRSTWFWPVDPLV